MSEPKKILYVEVPQSVHRAVKILAASESRLISDIVAEALKRYVATRVTGRLEQPGEPKSPKFPKSPRQPPARTGPGSPGYLAPMSRTPEEDKYLSEPLPIATDDENPFALDILTGDLLPEEGG